MICNLTDIKATKLELLDGRRDELAVNACLYPVEVYISTEQTTGTNSVPADNAKIAFVLKVMKGTAAGLWCMKVQTGTTLGN